MIYRDIIAGLVIDPVDAPLADGIRALGIEVCTTPTLMRDLETSRALARTCLEFGSALGRRP